MVPPIFTVFAKLHGWLGTLAAEKDFWLKPQNIRLSLSSGIARRHSYAAASDVRRAQQRLQQG
jgi:hypothetical protein